MARTKSEFLRPAGEFTLPESTDSFNPNQYFQTREGLYAWVEFKNRILSVAQPTDGFAETTLAAFDLIKPANDAEIRSDLPEDHVFEDASEFCATLAQMMDWRQQSAGEKGNPLSCQKDLFYVRGVNGEVFVVDVYRSADDRAWHVLAFPLDGRRRWLDGCRAFSATA